MRIGFVIYDSIDSRSGGYYYDRRLVEALRAQGDVVEVISLPRRSYGLNLLDNLRFRIPDGIESQQPATFRAMGASHREFFDVVIEDELNHPSLIAANNRQRRFPIVSLVHHLRASEPRAAWQNAIYSWMERKYLDTIDGAIVNSVATRNALAALIGERAPTIIAPPPTDRFGGAIPEKEVAVRAFEPGPLRLIFVGSVTRRKGLDTLLQALQSLPASDWRLEVVGSLETEVPAAKRARRRAAALGSANGVEFRGHLGDDELAVALRQAQVLVVPSTYEGFGIAYVEGMAYGLPAIGTTAGAAPETIQDGINGFLISPGNAALLSDRLRQLHANRQLLATMAVSARRTYLSRPAWGQTVGRIRDFLGMAIADFTCYNH